MTTQSNRRWVKPIWLKIISVCAVFLISSTLSTPATFGRPISAATAKSLSTNFTLVNLGSQTATVYVRYFKENGTSWPVDTPSSYFTIAPNGGQAAVRQYYDSTMAIGRGSGIASSDQPLAGIVQILARTPQVPTSGAYLVSPQTATRYYVPLVMRRLVGAGNAVTSSQILVQNVGSTTVSVTIQLIKSANSGGANFTKSTSIAAGTTFYYDLADESVSNVADGWYGSAVVDAGGQIAVVSNIFSGADTLQTFNAFRPDQLSQTWFVPLFTSRLANGLSTPVTVQNLSGSSMNAGSISMICLPDPGSNSQAPLNVSNGSLIGPNESAVFNPVVDTVSFPIGDWYGSCRISAPGMTVAFVQMRKPGVSAEAAAYEAINGNGTNHQVIVPMVAKRLPIGFATPVTIQNLHPSPTVVDIKYTPSREYINIGGSDANLFEYDVTIPGYGSINRNFRLAETLASLMPDGWYGTMTVVARDNRPIDGFVQLTTLGATTGDTLMAHGVFTQP